MICPQCSQERSQGASYRYHYGSRSVRRDPALGWGVRRTYFAITGQGTEWICTRCTGLHSWASLGLLAIFILAGLLLVTFQPLPWLLFILVMVYCLAGLALPPGGRRAWGELLALRRNRVRLQAGGASAFLTGSEFDRLKKRRDVLGGEK